MKSWQTGFSELEELKINLEASENTLASPCRLRHRTTDVTSVGIFGHQDDFLWMTATQKNPTPNSFGHATIHTAQGYLIAGI